MTQEHWGLGHLQQGTGSLGWRQGLGGERATKAGPAGRHVVSAAGVLQLNGSGRPPQARPQVSTDATGSEGSQPLIQALGPGLG